MARVLAGVIALLLGAGMAFCGAHFATRRILKRKAQTFTAWFSADAGIPRRLAAEHRGAFVINDRALK